MISQIVSVILLSCSCYALEAPSLVNPTTDTVIATLGDELELPCQFSGDPAPSVSWYKDDMAVSVNMIRSNGSLFIQSFQANDEGFYHCTAANDVGSLRSPETLVLMSRYRNNFDKLVVHNSEILAVSRKADIDVSTISTTLTITPFSAQGKETIICPSDSCPVWVHVAVVDRSTALAVVRLEYPKLNQTFPGQDRFLVNAQLGRLNEEPFTAQFNGKSARGLTVDVRPENTTIESGRDAVLFCISNAVNSTYTWKKNNKLLDVDGSDRLSLIMDGTLRIERATTEDIGVYSCTVHGPSFRPGTRTHAAFLLVYSRPQVSLKKTVSADGSGFLLSCRANGSGPMDVDFLCNGEIRGTGEIGSQPPGIGEIEFDVGLVTRDTVCQCLAYGDYGSVQDDVFVNMTELPARPPSPTPLKETGTPSLRPDTGGTSSMPPGIKSPNVAEDDGLSMEVLIGIIAAAVLVIAIVLVLIICAIRRNRKPRQESRKELTVSDIGDPVPAPDFLKSMEAGLSKGQSQSAGKPDKERHLALKNEKEDSKRNSRNDFIGTTAGDGVLVYHILGSPDSLVVSASHQKRDSSPFDDKIYAVSPGYDEPNLAQEGNDKQTRSVVSLRNDGYAVVGEDMRTQQNAVVEVHPGGKDTLKAKVSARSEVVGSGEYARLEPLSAPNQQPKPATPSSSVPYGVEDDLHFKMNGVEYAIADVGAKRKSIPSDEDTNHMAYAVSELSKEEKEDGDPALRKATGIRGQPARADNKVSVTYATLMPVT